MDKDRKAVFKIVSDMLYNKDVNGIFITETFYDRIEHYIESVRAEAIGWAHADACCDLDNGNDPRLTNIQDILARAQKDLAT